MGKARKHAPERLMNILRQIEAAVVNGKTHPMANREPFPQPTADEPRVRVGCGNERRLKSFPA